MAPTASTSGSSGDGLRKRGGATRPGLASRGSSSDSGRRGSEDISRTANLKGKRRASTVASVPERRKSSSGSDDLLLDEDDEEEDYLRSSSGGSGQEEEPYGKFANSEDGHDAQDPEHSFSGPAHYVSKEQNNRSSDAFAAS